MALLLSGHLSRKRARPFQSDAVGPDVMAFVQFEGWTCPEDATELLRAPMLDVQAFKASMVKHGGGPNCRSCSLCVAISGKLWSSPEEVESKPWSVYYAQTPVWVWSCSLWL